MSMKLKCSILDAVQSQSALHSVAAVLFPKVSVRNFEFAISTGTVHPR
jgi:hypothetical protein